VPLRDLKGYSTLREGIRDFVVRFSVLESGETPLFHEEHLLLIQPRVSVTSNPDFYSSGG
jgi:hypothetical protein